MDKNKTLKLGILCCLVYFTSYITRINYAAALAEIVRDMQISKQIASIAVTGSFITYGAGQIISGILGDKFKPRKVIAFGLAATSLINLFMSFLPGITLMTVFWCFNGFFQALIWPPLVRLMTENMNGKEYSRYVLLVTASASVATIAVYMMVPAAISISGWRLAFTFSGTFGLAVTVLWSIGTLHIKESSASLSENKTEEKSERKFSGDIIRLLIPIMVAIIVLGILRDGITTWMPTYISEVFDMGASVSILSTAILPIFSILSISIANILYSKLLSEIKASAVFFAVAFVCCCITAVAFSKSVVLCILMMSVITGCAHGANLMLIGQMPVRFIKYGKVSTISGILNAGVYIGSAISTYGFAALADNFGWHITVLSWAAVALISVIICISLIKKWKQFCAN